MGNYRGQVKAPRRLGMNPSLELRPGIYTHWEKCAERGEKLPARWCSARRRRRLRLGAEGPGDARRARTSPAALVGVPINVVKAKTVDLLVPAEAEIVVEGCIDTEYLEPEAPFGESHGHVNLQEYNAFMDVTAITRRRDAILTSIISQVTPSESSLIKRVGMEPLFLNYLRNTLGIKGVKRVSMHEPLTNMRKVIAMSLRARHADARKCGARSTARPCCTAPPANTSSQSTTTSTPTTPTRILWAMSYRANPTLDLQSCRTATRATGPRSQRNDGEDASVLIDATLKEDFPPISLPKREFMERAKAIWDELGLPAQARGAVVRLFAGRMVGRARRGGAARGRAATISRPAKRWKSAAARMSA